ncbi:putative MFS family arabinose efflux permease [Streptomyces sp. 3330]|uniref:MFS transporter n=1 Tax=Streptomyces sp. 3330 TaxID=2817755 RepID=UPI00285AEED5|nr:MFS transporter [Streptomyces sp. 3330]MDR6976924.1 putative MFS family arabinose efflux permease [Streptomyces sp. 3330]
MSDVTTPPAPAPPGAPATGTPAAGGYLRVFAVREFRAVFAAHLLSMLGVIVAEIALSVLVYDLTGSALMSALAWALGFLPYVVGGTLLAGVADRFPARRVLVGCDLVCAVCVLPMTAPGAPLAVLLALRCCLAVVSPVFAGTRTATLADILGEGDLFVLGRSLLRITAQSALLAGFGLGGLLLTVASPRQALLVTAGTFLASATLLRFGTRRRPARAGTGGALVTDSLKGARQILADRRIRALLLLFWVPPTFTVAPEALSAPYADDLGVGPTGLGLLMCALPVGAIAGELYAGSRLRPVTRERVALPLVCVTLLPYLGYALHPGLAVSLLLLVVSGAGSAYTLGLDQWIVRDVPPELRGRAMTLLTAGLMTFQGVGMALAGVAAELVGVAAAVTGAGVLGTVCCVLSALEVRRTEGRDGADHDMTGR